MEPERRQQNVATAPTKSVETLPPKRKTLNKHDLKGEILSRVRGGVNPPLREGVKNYSIASRIPPGRVIWVVGWVGELLGC